MKIDVIPNGLEKYMAFMINKNFIGSMQVINSSLEKLVKHLADNGFKYLSQEFGSENLELLKQKDVYCYQYIKRFKRFSRKDYLIKNISTGLWKMEQLVMMVKN